MVRGESVGYGLADGIAQPARQKYRPYGFWEPVGSLGYSLQGLEHHVHSLEYRVHSLKYRVHSLEYHVHSLEYGLHSLEYRLHSLEYRLQGLEYGVADGMAQPAGHKYRPHGFPKPVRSLGYSLQDKGEDPQRL